MYVIFRENLTPQESACAIIIQYQTYFVYNSQSTLQPPALRGSRASCNRARKRAVAAAVCIENSKLPPFSDSQKKRQVC